MKNNDYLNNIIDYIENNDDLLNYLSSECGFDVEEYDQLLDDLGFLMESTKSNYNIEPFACDGSGGIYALLDNELVGYGIGILPNAEKTDIAHLYELLIQAALFSNIGISREELLNELKLSENTLRSRLRLIPEILLIENRQKGRKYYLLDLDATDKLFED